MAVLKQSVFAVIVSSAADVCYGSACVVFIAQESKLALLNVRRFNLGCFSGQHFLSLLTRKGARHVRIIYRYNDDLFNLDITCFKSTTYSNPI